MRTFGHGKAEKDAAWGALQWRRGEAPNAALRLSPTFIADNGQRMKPHAASATINARAKPHATARRMVSTSPFAAPANRTRRLIPRTGEQGDNALKHHGQRAHGEHGNGGAWGHARSPTLDLTKRGSGTGRMCSDVRALRPKHGGEQARENGKPRSRH